MSFWDAENVMANSEFMMVFARLKAILEPYAAAMDVQHDEEGVYSLDTRTIMKNGKPLFFGSVQVKKTYVSFHLMPVYVFPGLLDDIGAVRARMQGKSCFNFRTLDEAHIAALTDLTRAGYERYRDAGMLGGAT